MLRAYESRAQKNHELYVPMEKDQSLENLHQIRLAPVPTGSMFSSIGLIIITFSILHPSLENQDYFDSFILQ